VTVIRWAVTGIIVAAASAVVRVLYAFTPDEDIWAVEAEQRRLEERR
jgi:hypothetical protein